jgi:hypothetical protein
MNGSLKPVPKVKAAGVGGAAAFLLIYVASLLGVDLPNEVAQAIVLVAAFAGGYIKKS